MKTIKEWFEEMPDEYRERALANLDPKFAETEEESLVEAVLGGFTWRESLEGTVFWDDIYEFLKGRKDELPDIPKND